MEQIPEGVSVEDLQRAKETAQWHAAKIVHTVFAAYLKDIGQKKLAKLMLRASPCNGLRSLSLKLNDQYTLILLLVAVDSRYKIDIYIPPIGMNDRQFAETKELLMRGIGNLKAMAILYFKQWIDSTELGSKIKTVCGQVYYDVDESNQSYIRLYKNGNPIGEKQLIGVGHYYMDNGKPLFPQSGQIGERMVAAQNGNGGSGDSDDKQ